MLKYKIILFWSEADQVLLAEVPALAGCLADGATPSAALERIETVAQEWLETARELGRPVPEPCGA